MAIQRAVNRTKEFLGSLSPALRAVLGAALAAIVLGVAFWCYRGWGGADVHLLGGRTFNASEVTAAQAAFAKANLNAAHIDGNRIRVPRGAESSYVAAMAEDSVLPDDFHKTLDKTLSELNAFTSSKQQEARINNAKQRVLADIIREMPGIEKAAVIIDQKREPGLGRKETVVASVTVFPQLGQPLEPRRLDAIRRLVKASIAGLALDNVTVTDGRTGASTSSPADPSSGEGSAHSQAAMKHKKEMEATVLEALGFVPHVRVAANVELHREQESPKSVSVAISVPSTYFESVWQELKRQNESYDPPKPAPTLEEIEQAEKANIEQLVTSVIPPADKTNAAPRVHVAKFHYMPPPAPPVQAFADRALGWLGHYWITLGMFLLAILALFVLRSLLTSLRPAAPALAAASHIPNPDQLAAQTADPAGALRRETSAPSPRDELAQLVRQDPKSAANVIRGWISGTT